MPPGLALFETWDSTVVSILGFLFDGRIESRDFHNNDFSSQSAALLRRNMRRNCKENSADLEAIVAGARAGDR